MAIVNVDLERMSCVVVPVFICRNRNTTIFSALSAFRMKFDAVLSLSHDNSFLSSVCEVESLNEKNWIKTGEETLFIIVSFFFFCSAFPQMGVFNCVIG